MDRETALQNYQEAVSGKIEEFRSRIGQYLLEHAEDLEKLVKTAADLLGEQMKKQEKEYVCFLYFCVLKSDLVQRKYRIQLHGLDMRWYMDEEPVEVYVDAEELLGPLAELWDDLDALNQGYGGNISNYDIQNLLFDELAVIDSTISSILRYSLRDWEEKHIFDSLTRSPYWVLRWGEYRDHSEILIQTDRVEKEIGVWKEQLSRAARKPETLVFSYWYKGSYESKTLQELDMRFITFDECTLHHMTFQNCNMEGSRFPKSKITDCSFAGCNLQGADFRNCNLEHVSFEGANLTAAVFPAESLPFLEISGEQLQVIRLDREDEV